jgi:hypothetical protein
MVNIPFLLFCDFGKIAAREFLTRFPKSTLPFFSFANLVVKLDKEKQTLLQIYAKSWQAIPIRNRTRGILTMKSMPCVLQLAQFPLCGTVNLSLGENYFRARIHR